MTEFDLYFNTYVKPYMLKLRTLFGYNMALFIDEDLRTKRLYEDLAIFDDNLNIEARYVYYIDVNNMQK